VIWIVHKADLASFKLHVRVHRLIRLEWRDKPTKNSSQIPGNEYRRELGISRLLLLHMNLWS